MSDSDKKGGGFGPLAILFVVLGVVFGTSGGGDRSGESETSKASRSTGGGAGATEPPGPGLPFVNDVRRPYLEFREAAGYEPVVVQKADEAVGASLGRLLARDADHVSAEFLIATVPDPVDSRFGNRFDAMLEALQMAAVAGEWTYDRAWLPWWPSGRQISDGADLKPPADGREAALFQRQPGVVLFRKRVDTDTGPALQVLLMFLVGELPTSGIAKEPLRQSLEAVRAYREGLGAPAGGPATVRIVGPLYSGSKTSMTVTLAGWLRGASWSDGRVPRPWTIQVRSGSATRIKRDEFKGDVLKGAGLSDGQGVEVHFDSTLVPYDAARPALLEFLRRVNGNRPLGKVALLTESDTEFGKEKRDEDPAVLDGEMVTVMPFPFHISQLAAAYEKRVDEAKKAGYKLTPPSTRLPVKFDENDEARESVPSLAPGMTTVRAEFVVSKILETVSTENFRYVGIVASDTRDVIFIAGLVRRYCPDVQLFSIGGSLMLGHPRYADNLRGMVVASSYPLYSPAQSWVPPTKGAERRNLFSDETDQGTYNAAVSVLATGRDAYERMTEYGRPFAAIDEVERFWNPSGPPKDRAPAPRKPALWFSVVGQRGLWPLSYVPEPRGGDPAYTFVAPADPPAAGAPDLSAQEADLVDRLAWLLPHLNWLWTLAFMVMTTFAWAVFWQHTRHAQGRPPVMPLLVPTLLDTPERPWSKLDAVSREGLALGGWLVFTLTYALVGLSPGWLATVQTPWPVLLEPAAWPKLRPHHVRTVLVLWLAFYVGTVTLGALLWTAARRVSGWRLNPATVAVLWLCATLVVALGGLRLFLTVHNTADPNGWWLRLLPSLVGWRLAWGPWLGAVLLAAGLAALFARKRFTVVGDAALLCLIAMPASLALPQWFQLAWSSRRAARVWPSRPDVYDGRLFLDRALNSGSGVSAYVPIVLLTVITLAWVRMNLRRIHMAEELWGEWNAPPSPDWLERPLVELRRGFAIMKANLFEFMNSEKAHVAVEPPRGPAARAEGRRRKAKEGRDRKRRRGDPPPRPDAAPPAVPLVPGNVPPAPALPGGSVYRMRRHLANLRTQRVMTDYNETAEVIRRWTPRGLARKWLGLAALVLATVVGLRLFPMTVPSLDFPGVWATVLMAWVWALGLTVLTTLSRLILVWQRFDGLLRRLIELPMARAYDRLPPMFSRSFGRYLDHNLRCDESLLIPVQQWALVAEWFDSEPVRKALWARFVETTDEGGTVRTDPESEAAFREAADHLTVPGDGILANGPGERVVHLFADECAAWRRTHGSDPRWRPAMAESKTWHGLRNAARASLDILDMFWSSKAASVGYGDPLADPAKAPAPKEERGVDDDLSAWLRAAEDLVALEVVALVSQIGAQVKNLVHYLALAPILLLVSVSTYPLIPQRFLQACFWTLIVMVVGAVVTIYVQLERNELLSRVSRTTPNAIALDRQFLGSVSTFVLPLVAIVLAQFPFFSDTMSQWFEPLLRVLK